LSDTGEEKLDYDGIKYHLFIDFGEAHDSVRREILQNILTEF
jgi:hypothetical protein